GHAYENAAHYSILAAETSARRFAYRDAVQTLQHALALVARIPASARAKTEIEILETMGDAHYCLGAITECAQAHEQQAGRAADGGLKAAEVSALNCLVRPVWVYRSEPGGCCGRARTSGQCTDERSVAACTD